MCKSGKNNRVKSYSKELESRVTNLDDRLAKATLDMNKAIDQVEKGTDSFLRAKKNKINLLKEKERLDNDSADINIKITSSVSKQGSASDVSITKGNSDDSGGFLKVKAMVVNKFIKFVFPFAIGAASTYVVNKVGKRFWSNTPKQSLTMSEVPNSVSNFNENKKGE